MRAMILAAGLGTRLRPLTDNRPKALVEINGRTMLELVLSRLRSFGVHDVIVNVFHFADMIQDYLKTNDNFGMKIELSREQELLDTGGGLKKAAHFFTRDNPHSEEPFILYNVDVLSTIDLGRMLASHAKTQALATLAVQDRKSNRYLLFDEQNQLCGRRSLTGDQNEVVRSADQLHPLAFSGIHVISSQFLPMMTEDGAFSIINTYLRLAANEKIIAFRADEYYWRDLGKPDNVKQAAHDLITNRITM